MFEPSVLIPFIFACVAIVVVPGPTVSLIIANSLRSGSAAGIANVVGTQAGLLIMIAVLAMGLDVVVAAIGEAFFWVKLAGAIYLIYLGIRLLRSDGTMGKGRATSRSLSGYAVQGFLVIWSNPKALLFFGAFIPQFVDPTYAAAPQVVLYGCLFMVVATLLDSAYALAAGRAGRLLTRRRVRLVEIISGSALVTGGVALAFSRR